MSIYANLNDLTLARRLEQVEAESTQQYVDTRAQLCPSAGCATRRIGDGVAFFAGAGSPINRVVALGMGAAVESADLAACEQFYRERGEPVRIDLCPLAHPSLLTALQHGYGVGQFKNVYARSLTEWPDVVWRGSGIQVAPVVRADAARWAQTVVAAVHGATPDTAAVEIARPNPYKPDTVCFLAQIDETPAGGGALAIHSGVALLYSTSVRPELRRMGVHAALLHARLSYAREHGCDLAMVQTAPGSPSQNNVERFGFRIVYTKPTLVRVIPG